MFCKRCGKELSDEAFMCPECGEPTGVMPKFACNHVQEEQKKNAENDNHIPNAGFSQKGVTIVAFILTCIAFVTGIIFGAFFFVYQMSLYLLFILGATTILPALVGLAVGVYNLVGTKPEKLVQALSITSIVLSSVVLLFLFIGGCVIVGIM